MIKLRMHPEEFRAIIWRLERIMADQTNNTQQLADLMGLLSDIQSDVAGEVSRLALLQNQLTICQGEMPGANLQPAIDLATSIKNNLEAATTPASSVTQPLAQPTPEPVATQTTDQSAATGDPTVANQPAV